MRVLTWFLASFSRLGCRLVSTKTAKVRHNAVRAITPRRFRINLSIPPPCDRHRRGRRRCDPSLRSDFPGSGFDPGLVEVLLQRLVLVAAMRAGAIGAVDLSPIRLDDHAGIAQQLLDVGHDGA